MLDAVDATNVDTKGIPFTVSVMLLPSTTSPAEFLSQIRTVFVVDPKKIIRLTISYPAQTGRSFDEILRVIDSLQVRSSIVICATRTEHDAHAARRQASYYHTCELEEGR
jgi:alkyl hydroperoxide reductase subunit AhpC